MPNLRLSCALFAAIFIAALGRADSTTKPAPAAPSVDYKDSNDGCQISYPGDWKPKDSKDDVLLLVPTADADNPGRSISLDVPSLPIHIPGMVTLRRVENGYLKDLKKQHAGLSVQDDKDQPLPDANAKIVRCTWTDSGKQCTEVSLLATHAGGVYLITLDSLDDHYSDDRKAFDAIVASFKWVK